MRGFNSGMACTASICERPVWEGLGIHGSGECNENAATVIIGNIACSASCILELLARAILALTSSRVSVRADRGEAAAALRAGDSPFRLQGGTLLSFHTWTTTRCPSSQQWHRRFGHPRSWGRSPSDRER